MIAGTSFDFKTYAAERRLLVEEALKQYLAVAEAESQVLADSMRYSVLSGGKRLRALLCLAAAESINPAAMNLALPCACAIEMVHAMSLIHDDLPALDNDDLRRGQPTNHKVYGEAIALLAGDALLCLAPKLLLSASKDALDSSTLLLLAEEFLNSIQDMVGGQVEDVSLTGLSAMPPEAECLQLLQSMHRRKTGSLIRFSLWSGAAIAGASQNQLEGFKRFGEVLGLAFQITDDLLDVVGDKAQLGKTPGKDQAANKITWVRLFGIAESKAKLTGLAEQAGEILVSLGLTGESSSALSSLLDYAIHRVN